MELIVISESKLKVMLSAEDMNEYALDDMNNAHTKEAFRNLMREAQMRCGFNGLEGRVFVQLYRSRSGGCELFVTKLAKEDYVGENGGTERSRTEHLRKDEDTPTECCRRSYSNTVDRGRHVIYRFDELRHLLSICSALLVSCYSGSGIAYAEQNRGAFYLVLDAETYAAGEHFGKLCPSSFYYYINEHCRLLCEDAVSVLGRLA